MQENFILDYFSVDWDSLINNDKDVNLSFNNFLKRINAILDNHAPLRKVTQKKLRLRSKPWTTLGLQKSISIKNSLFAKFIKSNYINQKNEMHVKYKQYRNFISTLLKRSKCLYFTNFFNDNLNNLKNTWKGIKNLISLKTLSHSSSIYYNNKTVTSPFETANGFNNYFSNIALEIQSSIQYSAKEFHEFLPPLSIKSFFLSPNDKNEIISIISALDSQKASGPNSIPIKILKLMKNDISDQLAVLFKCSFTSGSFPTILKTSKVTPIYKKDSKLKCSNYRPISLLSNIDKILERIVYNHLYKFFEDNKLVYNLQFGFQQKHSTTHALIHLTEKIWEKLDSGKYGCRIFVNFQKAFDNVDHKILTQKLNYYSVRGKANN